MLAKVRKRGVEAGKCVNDGPFKLLSSVQLTAGSYAAIVLKTWENLSVSCDRDASIFGESGVIITLTRFDSRAPT